MFAARRLSVAPRAGLRRLAPSAPFHASAPALVKVGDKIPNVELMEGSPGNKVNIAGELKGNGLIIGVPAAFSPACSESHIPGYINSSKLKGAGSVFVVSVNDAFVYVLSPVAKSAGFSGIGVFVHIMKAWGKTLDPSGSSGIRFLADPNLDFTNALDLGFDGTAIFGGHRGKRYALVVEDGVVKEAHVEPDNTGMSVSTVAKVLGE